MRKHVVAFFGAMLAASVALAANVPNMAFWDPTNALGSLNGLIQTLNSAITPGSMAPYAMGRNFIDNGAMLINQRPFVVVPICATTSGPIQATGTTAGSYASDRWACDINMASGAGLIASATSSPTPPTGFTNEETLVRNSGALLQPVCAEQEIETKRATQMAGQTVILSAYMQALAGLSADNGNLANMYLITGTGTNQGLGASTVYGSAVGMTTTTKGSSFTISTTTGLITNATTVVAGQPVTITAATLPVGIVSTQVYYVSSALLNSGTAFAIAPTYAQAIAGTNTVIPTTAGTTNIMNFSQITPVWTGLAIFGPNNAGAGGTSVSQELGQAMSNTFTLSASAWGRFSTGPISVPTNVTEAAVLICFTPLGTTSGSATDGLAFDGVQLEIAGPNQTTPSPYEFKSVSLELQEAYRFAWVYAEPAAAVTTPWIGVYQTATSCDATAATPVTMAGIPQLTFVGPAAAPTATTFAVLNSVSATAPLSTPFMAASTINTANVNSIGLTLTTATVTTAGLGCVLTGHGGLEFIVISADF